MVCNYRFFRIVFIFLLLAFAHAALGQTLKPGPQVLTQLSGDWPRVIGHYQNQTVPRADMLVV